MGALGVLAWYCFETFEGSRVFKSAGVCQLRLKQVVHLVNADGSGWVQDLAVELIELRACRGFHKIEPQTPNPKPQTPNPKPQTPNPKP